MASHLASVLYIDPAVHSVLYTVLYTDHSVLYIDPAIHCVLYTDTV